MDDCDSYEISVAAGKQISSLKVYRDEQDREVLIAFSDGPEIAISDENTVGSQADSAPSLERPGRSSIEPLATSRS